MKLVVLLLALIPLSALADETIAVKEAWASYDKMLEEKVAKVNTACGSKLTAAFDKASYPNFDPMHDRSQSACRDVMNTLVAVCASPAGKEGVQKVARVTCRSNEARTGLVKSGGELIVDISQSKTAIIGKDKGSYSWQSAIKELL